MRLTRSDVVAVPHQHPKPISSTHKVKRERETYVSLGGDDLICMQEMSVHVCTSWSSYSAHSLQDQKALISGERTSISLLSSIDLAPEFRYKLSPLPVLCANYGSGVNPFADLRKGCARLIGSEPNGAQTLLSLRIKDRMREQTETSDASFATIPCFWSNQIQNNIWKVTAPQ